MRLMLLNDSNVEKDMNYWRWYFADDDKRRVSSVFSIDFSSGKSREWTIHVSKLARLEQMIGICQRACDANFITLTCDEEVSEFLRQKLETVSSFVINLRAITCLDDKYRSFSLTGNNAGRKVLVSANKG